MKKIMIAGLMAMSVLSVQAMELTSNNIFEGSRMSKRFEFNGFGCSGSNMSPALVWSNAPKGTKSFAVTMYDPDAPTISGFWHWVVIDLPATKTSLKTGESGKITRGIERINDYGIKGFGGACPPKGDGMHRYQVTVWALPDATLGVPDNASNAVVGFMLNAKALASKTITSTYVR